MGKAQLETSQPVSTDVAPNIENRGLNTANKSELRQAQNKRKGFSLRGFYLPVTVVVIWQFIGSLKLAPSTVLPSPLQIVQALVSLTMTGQLIQDIEISLFRTIAGFLLGGTLGFSLGLASGLFKYFEDIVDPSIKMLLTIPHLAITPLFILWFGLGEWSKILLIALGAFFPMYINTYMGIRNVDAKLFEVARILEFNRRQQLTKLVIPAASPNILLGLRLSLGISWLSLVVAELMGSSSGVGYLIENATQFSLTAEVFVGLIIFAVVGKISDSLVRILEGKLLRWQDNYLG